MTTHPPQKASDFETVFYPDGTCGVFDGVSDCRQPGVILAQEIFSPFNDAMWFCALHWPEFEKLYSIVEDKRTQETIAGSLDKREQRGEA